MSYPAATYPFSAYQHPQNTPYSYQHPTTPYSAAQPYPPWPYGFSYPHPHLQAPTVAPAAPPTAPRPPLSGYPTTTTFASYPPTNSREPSSSNRPSRRQSNLKGLFTKELPKLMYGFGDDKQVANDTVNVMEEILVEYIVDVCQTAIAPTRKARLQIEDLRRALSRPADAKKLARMEELLFMQEDIKRARKQFEENEVNPGGGF